MNLIFSRDKIFRFAMKLLGNYEDAQDVTQDIIEKLWKKRSSINGIQNIEAFAIKMTKDLCLDRIKHQKNKSEALKNLANPDLYIQANYDNRDLADITKKLIEKLPDKQKIIIHLRDVEEYEFEELATIMEMDINAVRMNVSRARKTIREQIIKITNHGLH